MKTSLSITTLALIILSCNPGTEQTYIQDSSLANAQAPAAISHASFSDILAGYMNIKDALVKDDAEGAAEGGKSMTEFMNTMDQSIFSEEQKKIVSNVWDDAKKHAENIADNKDKIDNQREHFEMLSKDMYAMAKIIKTDDTLYYANCPMYNKGAGGNWLSKNKEITNPYMGQQMPDCGSVKEEIK